MLQLCPVPEREPNSPSTQRLLLLDRQGPNCPCFTAPRRTPNFTFKQQNPPGIERAHHSGSHTQALILLSLQTHTPNRPSLPHWLPMHFLAINIWVFYLGWFLQALSSKGTNAGCCNGAPWCLLGAGHAEPGWGLCTWTAPQGAAGDSTAARHKPSWSSQVHRGAHLSLNYSTARGLLPGKADPALKASAKDP